MTRKIFNVLNILLIIMAGGLLQMIAYGAQDMYLTNNPHITFFKVVYRRHTNFSIQSFEATFNDKPNFGNKGTVKLYRLGDLATKMYLRVVLQRVRTLPGINFAWVRRIGHAMLSYVNIEIGGTVIDKHYGTWLDIWYELTREGDHERGYAKMIGDVDEMTKYNDKTKPEYTLYIPLRFWFNKHYGLALPLISIQYHDIYVNIEFEERTKLLVRCESFANLDDLQILDVGLVTDYIYLDYEERYRFAKVSHEYLMEQVQYFGDEPIDNVIKRMILDFNHPAKEIIWAARNGNYTQGKRFLCYSNKEDWTDVILDCSRKILIRSMILLKGPTYGIDSSGNRFIIEKGTPPPDYGKWEEFEPGSIRLLSTNGNFEVTNNSEINSLWLNLNSLAIGNYSITDKIRATIVVNTLDQILIEQITSGILDRDISFPVDVMTDTRLPSESTEDEDVCVYQFSNYGLYITGKRNPTTYAMLEYNGQNRVEKRNGRFFGVLQPFMHHTSTPIDGINVYSFALEPQKLQPTGVSNLSKIENKILTVWFENDKQFDEPDLEFINPYTRLFVYCFSYNIFKVVSGLTGLAYNG